MKIRLLVAVVTTTLITAHVSVPGQQSARDKHDASVAWESRQTPGAEVQPLPVEIAQLVDEARTAPAEFAADILIRLAESDKVVDRKWKRELLEEAFRRAAGAQQPVKRDYAGGNMDTREGYLSLGLDLNLDTLSLQCRVVKAMLLIDPQRARELFGEIPPKHQLPPLNCKDALVYNVSEFYDTLGKVIEKAFSPAEKQRGAHIQFVQPYIDNMTSPVQVGPVAKVILSLKPSGSQLAVLVHSFGEALKGITNDDRSFSFFTTQNSVAQHVGALVKMSEKRGVPKQDLLEALRAYLVRNLSSGRCSDSASVKRQHVPDYIYFINKTLFAANPISADEIKPLKFEEALNVSPYWQSPEAKGLLMKVKRLRFESGDKPLTAAQKEDPQWQLQATQFLNDLADWNGKQEKSEADYFHQKSVLYRALLDILPAGPQRREVLGAYVLFLKDNYVQRDSRIEWFLHANNLIERASSPRGDERPKLLEALSNSGNGVLQLYAALIKLAPQPKEEVTNSLPL